MALTCVLGRRIPWRSVRRILFVNSRKIHHMRECTVGDGGDLAQRKDSRDNWDKGRLAGKVGLTLALLFCLEEERRRKGDCFLLGKVSAAQVVGSNNRDKFNFISDVVQMTASTVVYIELVHKSRVDFFTGSPVPQSNGSGFIIREDGLILTNAHVIMGRASSIVQVKLQDGTIYQGVVEDIDMKRDLATVRIKAHKKLPVMRLGDSSDIRPGEWVVAMGSPLSLSNTITAGIISTVHRTSRELKLNKDMDYIQTDASITFGNSGGPLVNLNGEAIGINSMKVAHGISFAIPIDYAKEFIKCSENKKKGIESPERSVNPKRYMGITMLTLTPDLIRELHNRNHVIPSDVNHGVLVWRVVVGSPAHLGGLQPGDIVTHINKKPVMGANTIYQVLESVGPLEMDILRGGTRKTIVIQPEES